jgi:hypothetical protein
MDRDIKAHRDRMKKDPAYRKRKERERDARLRII